VAVNVHTEAGGLKLGRSDLSIPSEAEKSEDVGWAGAMRLGKSSERMGEKGETGKGKVG